MNLNELSALLRRCRYKPGSKFECEPICVELASLRGLEEHDVLIHISMEVRNVFDEVRTSVRGSFKLDRYELEHMTQTIFLERLRNEITRTEEHEIDEWFLVDGNCYREPHPEIRGERSWDQKPKNQDASQRLPKREKLHSYQEVSMAGTMKMISPEDVRIMQDQKNQMFRELLDSAMMNIVKRKAPLPTDVLMGTKLPRRKG